MRSCSFTERTLSHFSINETFVFLRQVTVLCVALLVIICKHSHIRKTYTVGLWKTASPSVVLYTCFLPICFTLFYMFCVLLIVCQVAISGRRVNFVGLLPNAGMMCCNIARPPPHTHTHTIVFLLLLIFPFGFR